MGTHTGEAPHEVIVIGGGHAGLSISYFLKIRDIDHVVLERGKIGESWRSQRWHSFVLNTPNWMSILPGSSYKGKNPDGFFSVRDFIRSLDAYAGHFSLPIQEHSNVVECTQDEDTEQFLLTVLENGETRHYRANQLVIASGTMNEKRLPSFASDIPQDILQVHTTEYKEAAQLPNGAVLVVGSAQSGTEIASDLLDAGRQVYLSTSKVPRVPRRYRGRDIMDWLNAINFLDMPTNAVRDPQVLEIKQPQVSGVGMYGRTVSLQSLAQRGAVILGKLNKVKGSTVHFQPNAALHVKFADSFSTNIKDMIEGYIQHNALHSLPVEPDPADEPDLTARCASTTPSLDLRASNITSIIWATGFASDFSWLHLPVFNEDGNPEHTDGISPVPGFYFLGFPWLRKRKSGIIFGIKEDAEFIAGHIANLKEA